MPLQWPGLERLLVPTTLIGDDQEDRLLLALVLLLLLLLDLLGLAQLLLHCHPCTFK